MEDVARQAGVSRALLYQHFPSKHALFAVVYQQAADRLLEATTFDLGATLVEQLAQGLDAHLDYFIANRHAVLAANRVLAGDPVIQTIMTDELDALRSRLLGVLPLADERTHAAVSAALKAWLVFVQVLCVDWLTRETCTRTELWDTASARRLAPRAPCSPRTLPRIGRPPCPPEPGRPARPVGPGRCVWITDGGGVLVSCG
jgi:AcrR family transcriptional regulator